MKELEAYELLQEFLNLAERLKNSGYYSEEELKHELELRIGGQ